MCEEIARKFEYDIETAKKVGISHDIAKELTDEEKFKKLENENLRLRQQLEFLKKMEFLVKQARYNKSKQEKDIKRLKKH
mgnify:CR=1 FL=1